MSKFWLRVNWDGWICLYACCVKCDILCGCLISVLSGKQKFYLSYSRDRRCSLDDLHVMCHSFQMPIFFVLPKTFF